MAVVHSRVSVYTPSQKRFVYFLLFWHFFFFFFFFFYLLFLTFFRSRVLLAFLATCDGLCQTLRFDQLEDRRFPRKYRGPRNGLMSPLAPDVASPPAEASSHGGRYIDPCGGGGCALYSYTISWAPATTMYVGSTLVYASCIPGDMYYSASGACTSDGYTVTAIGAGTCTATVSCGDGCDYASRFKTVSVTVYLYSQSVSSSSTPPSSAFGTVWLYTCTSSAGLPTTVTANGACYPSGAYIV
jgi:hypothetical protein